MTSAAKKSIGVLYILGAATCFALMNLFVNLAGDLPLMQKVFFRNALTVVVVFFILLFQKEKFRIHNKSCVLWLFLRAGIGFIGVILNFYAIDHIGSISDASILNKLSPFFAILFSVFLLKEKPTVPEIVFTVVAFAGAACVVNPRFDMAVLPAVAGLLSGACAGFAYTCVRVLAVKGERGIMTVFFFAVLSTVVSLPFFIAEYEPMSGEQLLYLLLAGASATGGQFFITAAYRKAPAKEIAVFDYSQVLFAALLGFFVLAQVPEVLSIVGYVVIIGAAVAKQIFHHIRIKKESGTAQELPTAEPDSEPPTAETAEENESPTSTKDENPTNSDKNCK